MMFGVELGGKSQPAPTVVPQEPDFGSMGLGPAYRSLMTSAMPTISFTSLPYTASPPRVAQLNTKWKCVSRPLTRSLRVGQASVNEFWFEAERLATRWAFLRTNFDQVAQRAAEECVGADRQPRIEVT